MKLRVLAVGTDRSGLFEPAADEYLKRLSRYAKAEVVELAASKKGGADPARARDEEGQALLAKLRPSDLVVVLDERGKELTSEELSRKVVQEAMNRGRDLAFLIGGAEGHAEAVRKRADLLLSLSRMTLPHRLARVVLLEQLYRAFAIARNEPYHKA